MNLIKLSLIILSVCFSIVCAQGQPKEVIESSKQYKWIDESWKNYFFVDYTYDDKGVLQQENSTWWQSDTVDYATKSDYIYDGFGNVVQMLTTQLSGGQWINESKITYEYINDSLMSTELSQIWNNEEWEDFFRYEYIYNEKGQLIETNDYYSDGPNGLAPSLKTGQFIMTRTRSGS